MNEKVFRYKMFARGDIDGFFGLFIDNLANLMILTTTLLGVINMPAAIVFGRILPAFGLATLLGSIYYFWQAKRLAEKEQRQDVTAFPFGAPTTAVFVFLFSIMLPVYFISGDPMTAWRVAVAACFVNGVIEVLGAFFGEQIRRITPRAALLGTLAGIAIAFIALTPTIRIFARPQIGFLPMAIILLAFIAKGRMPFKISAGLIAIVAGSFIAWVGGYMDVGALRAGVQSISFAIPTPSLGALFEGFSEVGPYLAVVVPLALHNFLSTMQNVESARAVGDSYDTKETMIVDGLSTILVSLFGGVLPTTVYIGHPGYKGLGSKAGYTLANGIAIALITMTGLMTLVNAAIPSEAVYPILLFIGLTIGAQAFQSTPKAHAPAVVIALIPHIANFGRNLVNNTANAAGLQLDADGIAALARTGINYEGMTVLAGGAILVGMLLAAMVAFLIDGEYKKASFVVLISAVLSFFGFIHGARIAFGAALLPAIGYLIVAVVFYLYSFYGEKANANLEH